MTIYGIVLSIIQTVVILLSPINQDTNFCIFSIEDTGQGVDIYTLEHLNKNGFIRNPDNTEHGLGLKIVNQIVHLHHGKNQILSE